MHEKLAVQYDENGILQEYSNRHNFYIGDLFEEGGFIFINENSINYPKTDQPDIIRLRSYLVSLYSFLQEDVILDENDVIFFKELHRQARKLSNKLEFCENAITHLLFIQFQEKKIKNSEIEEEIFKYLDLNTQNLTMSSFIFSWPISYPFLNKDISLIEKLLPDSFINNEHNLLTGFDRTAQYPFTGIDAESYKMKKIYKRSIMPNFNIEKDYDPRFESENSYLSEEEIGYSPSKEMLLYLLFLHANDMTKKEVNELKIWAENNPYIEMTEKQIEGILYLKTKNYNYELDNFEDWNFAAGEGLALLECFNKCNFRESDNFLNIILKQSKEDIEKFSHKNNDLIKVMIQGLEKNKNFSFELKGNESLLDEVNKYCETYKKIEDMYIKNDINENRTIFSLYFSNYIRKVLENRAQKGGVEAEKECLTLSLIIENKLQAFTSNKEEVYLIQQKVNRL